MIVPVAPLSPMTQVESALLGSGSGVIVIETQYGIGPDPVQFTRQKSLTHISSEVDEFLKGMSTSW
jgi:hypothetical protein